LAGSQNVAEKDNEQTKAKGDGKHDNGPLSKGGEGKRPIGEKKLEMSRKEPGAWGSATVRGGGKTPKKEEWGSSCKSGVGVGKKIGKGEGGGKSRNTETLKGHSGRGGRITSKDTGLGGSRSVGGWGGKLTKKKRAKTSPKIAGGAPQTGGMGFSISYPLSKHANPKNRTKGAEKKENKDSLEVNDCPTTGYTRKRKKSRHRPNASWFPAGVRVPPERKSEVDSASRH